MSDALNELDALALQATALDGAVDASGPAAMVAAQEEAAAMSLADANRQGVAMILDLALPIVGEIYPSLHAIYTPDARGRVAQALGPVMAKHNVDLQALGGRYGEEIAAVMVCGPIAWATVKGIKADIAQRAGQQPAKEIGAGMPEAEVVGPGLRPGDYGYVEPQ